MYLWNTPYAYSTRLYICEFELYAIVNFFIISFTLLYFVITGTLRTTHLLLLLIIVHRRMAKTSILEKVIKEQKTLGKKHLRS